MFVMNTLSFERSVSRIDGIVTFTFDQARDAMRSAFGTTNQSRKRTAADENSVFIVRCTKLISSLNVVDRMGNCENDIGEQPQSNIHGRGGRAVM